MPDLPPLDFYVSPEPYQVTSKCNFQSSWHQHDSAHVVTGLSQASPLESMRRDAVLHCLEGHAEEHAQGRTLRGATEFRQYSKEDRLITTQNRPQ